MIHNPHDGLFKEVLGVPEHARGALRAIVPAPLAAQLEWSTLALEPGSFVDHLLSHQHTDLLFSLRWRGGEPALLHLLFEHQSTPPSDGLMALRLLHYQARIWRRWHIDHPRTPTLPAILAIVLYHGESAWTEAIAFDELLDVPASLRPALEPHLVRFRYVLHDLSHIPDDELRKKAMTALTRLTFLCFKHAREDDFLERLGGWLDLVREIYQAPHGREAVEAVMRYILKANQRIRQEDLEPVLEPALESQTKDIIMATGDQLTQQGIQQGIQRTLLRQLRKRFGSEVDARIEQHIANASAHQLDAWSDRVLTAQTLADVLAE